MRSLKARPRKGYKIGVLILDYFWGILKTPIGWWLFNRYRSDLGVLQAQSGFFIFALFSPC